MGFDRGNSPPRVSRFEYKTPEKNQQKRQCPKLQPKHRLAPKKARELLSGRFDWLKSGPDGALSWSQLKVSRHCLKMCDWNQNRVETDRQTDPIGDVIGRSPRMPGHGSNSGQSSVMNSFCSPQGGVRTSQHVLSKVLPNCGSPNASVLKKQSRTQARIERGSRAAPGFWTGSAEWPRVSQSQTDPIRAARAEPGLFDFGGETCVGVCEISENEVDAKIVNQNVVSYSSWSPFGAESDLQESRRSETTLSDFQRFFVTTGESGNDSRLGT